MDAGSVLLAQAVDDSSGVFEFFASVERLVLGLRHEDEDFCFFGWAESFV